MVSRIHIMKATYYESDSHAEITSHSITRAEINILNRINRMCVYTFIIYILQTIMYTFIIYILQIILLDCDNPSFAHH